MNAKEEGLALAEVTAGRENGEYVWRGEAHGVVAFFTSNDPTLELFVSPILTMREKGVALVDSNGFMRVNRRENR